MAIANEQLILKLGVETAEGELKKVRNVRQLFKDLNAAAKKLSSVDVNIDPAGFDKAQKELEDTVRKAKKAQKALAEIPDKAKPGKLQKLVGIFNNLKTAVAGFFAAIVVRKIFELGSAVSDAAIDLERLKNGLDALEGVEADEVLERIRERAEALGVDLKGAEQSTTSFVKSAVAMGLTLEESLSIVEGFGAAVIGAGKGSEELRRVFVQLEQGIAKGKFQMQDLRIIMEAVPGVAVALADGLGITTAALFDLQSKGLVPAKEAALILAAELPKIFDEALVKNASDFRSEVQRLKNDFFEAGREIGKNINPELAEWLRLLKEIGGGGSFVDTVSESVIGLSSTLRELVVVLTSLFRGDWNTLWREAERTVLDFQRGVVESMRQVFAGLDFITPGERFVEQQEFFAGKVAEIDERIAEKRKQAQDSFLQDTLLAEEQAARDRLEVFRGSQAERQELGDKAAAEALAKIKAARAKEEEAERDSNEKKLKDLGDFAAEREKLLSGETDGDVSVGVKGEGIAGVRGQLSDIQTLAGKIKDESAGGLLAAGAQTDIQALFDAFAALGETENASRRAAGGLKQVEDVTDQLAKRLDTLSTEIAAGGSEFDLLGTTARSTVGLILTQMQRLKERGGVQAFELAELLGALDDAFGKSGDASQSAAGKVLDYNAKLEESNQKVGEVTRNLDEAAGKIEQIPGEDGAKKFSNLGTGAEEAATGVGVLDDKLGGANDLMFSYANAAEDAAAAQGDVAAKAPEAATGVGDVGKAAEEAAVPVGDLQAKTSGLATDLTSITTATGPLSTQLPALLASLTENQEGLTSAVTAGQSLSESLPIVGTQITAIQAAVTLLSTEGPALLAAITEAQDKEVFAGLGKQLEIVAKGATAIGESSEGLKAAIDALLKGGEEKEKLEGLATAIERMAEPGLVSRTKEQGKNLSAVATGLGEIATEAEELGADDGPVKKALEKLTELVDFLNDKVGPAVDKAVGELNRFKESIGEILEDVGKLVDAFETRLPEAVASGVAASLAQLDVLGGRLDGVIEKFRQIAEA